MSTQPLSGHAAFMSSMFAQTKVPFHDAGGLSLARTSFNLPSLASICGSQRNRAANGLIRHFHGDPHSE